MTWPGWGPDRTVVVHVEHGEILDLRIDGAPVGPRAPPDELAVEVSTAGSVTDQAKRYAVEKLQHVIARVTAPVLFARVKLRHLGDPAAQRPAQAEAPAGRERPGRAGPHRRGHHDRGDRRAGRPPGSAAGRPAALVPDRGRAAGDRRVAPGQPALTPRGVVRASTRRTPAREAQDHCRRADDDRRGRLRHGPPRLRLLPVQRAGQRAGRRRVPDGPTTAWSCRSCIPTAWSHPSPPHQLRSRPRRRRR